MRDRKGTLLASLELVSLMKSKNKGLSDRAVWTTSS